MQSTTLHLPLHPRHPGQPGHPGCFSHSLRPPRIRSKVLEATHGADALVSTASISTGTLTIQPLQVVDVQGAGLLLTRAFAGTPEAVKLDEALRYMQERVQSGAAASCLTLVAKLAPTDPLLLPPGKDSRLVGTVTLSFTAASRESFANLAPPSDEAYLANMAVDPKFRRQGIARAMLAACDCAAAAVSHQRIWLHVRQADDAGQQLYTGFGYEEVDRDQAKLSLFGLGGGGGSSSGGSRLRILMRRQLAAATRG